MAKMKPKKPAASDLIQPTAPANVGWPATAEDISALRASDALAVPGSINPQQTEAVTRLLENRSMAPQSMGYDPRMAGGLAPWNDGDSFVGSRQSFGLGPDRSMFRPPDEVVPDSGRMFVDVPSGEQPVSLGGPEQWAPPAQEQFQADGSYVGSTGTNTTAQDILTPDEVAAQQKDLTEGITKDQATQDKLQMASAGIAAGKQLAQALKPVKGPIGGVVARGSTDFNPLAPTAAERWRQELARRRG